ncbi:epoxide hydrolase family protein [Antrihabitans sp. YC2-6]|uniref:epoxide hydrolase family protein n=1 Tax=Antrihabitans sp. YC2-6 TaxID=2799498 RepID=UPI0018F7A2E9|nr:epoxide hydrolase family protein [Antrihabitans sp. YC2-6]MBJ8344397.1 epoxide hydrolase [Antrihabitans sp. YC2-6]
MSTDIVPFRIEIPQADLDDLRGRLDKARLPAPLAGDGWDVGTPTWWIRDLVEYWRTDFDWRAIEAQWNKWPQFVTEIDGQTVHFLHIRSAEPDARALVLTHGWPCTFVEFADVIGPLTDPRAHGGTAEDAFDLVIPSLPGFGFSTPLAEGWDNYKTGRAWAELMRRLGYDRFGVHGGDAGAAVSPLVGAAAPDRVTGMHVTTGPAPVLFSPPPADEYAELTASEQDRLDRFFRENPGTPGYLAVQASRPQTLAYGLVDSPVGQLAWIMDRFWEWTRPKEALPEQVIDKDVLLTNVMLYWLTGTAGTSAYATYVRGGGWGPEPSSGVPTGVLLTPIDWAIRRYSAPSHNITRWTELDHGGHFAALEIPGELVADLREFFRDKRS